MADFVRPEDWGLQAIVRGSSTSEFWNTTTDPNSCFTAAGFMEMQKDDHHSLVFNFPGLFDGASMLTDELQELCKPFYSVSCTSPSQNSPAGPTTSSSFSVCKEVKEEPGPDQPEEVCKKVAHMDKSSTATTTAYMPKYKRRKNQHKRVVLQVTAEDLTSDKWAWRKYGQKPIKGSPYPRSYYRCSSSKGCLARKQVEQSCTDPGIFIITYTAEHSHSQPTRRNALAGTIRHKFGNNPKSPTSNTSSKAAKSGDSGRCTTSPTPCLDLSPGTPLVAEEGSVERKMNKDETDHVQTMDERNSHKNGILFPEVMFDDDFFSCLNDFDGFISGLGDGHCSTGTLSSESDFL